MKKHLMISSLCLLSTLVNAESQTQTLPIAPTSADFADMVKKMQTLEQQLEVVQQDLKQLHILTAGTKAPLDQPLLKSEEVIDWVKGSILEIYSYNFANYKQVIANIAHYFTTPGYESYVKALQDAGNLSIIEEKKTIVTAMIVGDVKMLKEGVENNIYSWMVQVPLKVTYQDHAGVVAQDILATIQVVRINDEKHPQGIAIHSITAEAKPSEAKPAEANQTEAKPTSSTPLAPDNTSINNQPENSLPLPSATSR